MSQTLLNTQFVQAYLRFDKCFLFSVCIGAINDAQTYDYFSNTRHINLLLQKVDDNNK